MFRKSISKLLLYYYPFMLEQEDDEYLLLLGSAIHDYRNSIRLRHYLTSDALIPPSMCEWHTLYQIGADNSLIAAISLDRASFEELHRIFKEEYSKCVRSSIRRGGRPAVSSITALGII